MEKINSMLLFAGLARISFQSMASIIWIPYGGLYAKCLKHLIRSMLVCITNLVRNLWNIVEINMQKSSFKR